MKTKTLCIKVHVAMGKMMSLSIGNEVRVIDCWQRVQRILNVGLGLRNRVSVMASKRAPVDDIVVVVVASVCHCHGNLPLASSRSTNINTITLSHLRFTSHNE